MASLQPSHGAGRDQKSLEPSTAGWIHPEQLLRVLRSDVSIVSACLVAGMVLGRKSPSAPPRPAPTAGQTPRGKPHCNRQRSCFQMPWSLHSRVIFAQQMWPDLADFILKIHATWSITGFFRRGMRRRRMVGWALPARPGCSPAPRSAQCFHPSPR